MSNYHNFSPETARNLQKPPETMLILHVVEQLKKYENAQCVIVTSDVNGRVKSQDHSLEKHLTDAEIAMILLFEASGPTVSESLTQIGKLCPQHILIFEKQQNAAEFLKTHESHLRCLK